MPQSLKNFWVVSTTLALLLVLNGCGKGEMAALKKAAAATTQAVAEIAKPTTGQMDLPLPEFKTIEETFGSYDPPADGHAGILQIASYPNIKQEKFPAVYFRAESDATNAGELAGKKVRAWVFVQLLEHGPLWHAGELQPLELTITEATPYSVKLELADVEFSSSENLPPQKIKGKIVGKLVNSGK